jgi:hypothetical protein
MRVAILGTDVVTVSEENIDTFKNVVDKVHLVFLGFKNPTRELMEKTLRTFQYTNRFIVDGNIKFYNDFLKNTNKKYYVKNIENTKLITFLRRNNKILLDFTCLTKEEKTFILKEILEDLLFNVEVVMIERKDYVENKERFLSWRGNAIVV